MSDLPPVLVALLTAALVAVMLWFALGTQQNIRKGNDLMRWLQGGLPLLGERTTVRWLGSSAVELKITRPRPPFSEAEALVVLEPRDVSILWAWARSRGRRDFLILRGRLERSPEFELEAGEEDSWTGRDRLDRLDWSAWESEDWELPGVRVGHSHGADVRAARECWEELNALGGRVWRISVRRDKPHLEVHLVPPRPSRGEAEPVVRAYRDLARKVISKP